MTRLDLLDHLYNGHSCENCKHFITCKINPQYSVCEKWEEAPEFGPGSILNIVRLAYPNTIKGDLIKEFPLSEASGTIHYLKPVYTNEDEHAKDELTLDIKEDTDHQVVDMLNKWQNIIKDVSDDKKSTIAQLLENQEAYLNSINTGKK